MPPRSQTQGKRRKPQKRGTAGRAATARGGKASTQQGGGLSNLILGFIAGLLVGSLAVALWYEKQSAPVATEQEPSINKPVAKAQPKEDPTPKPGNEFYDQLPNAKVETFSDKKDDTPLTPYVLQTGAFRTRAEADQMEARIVLETGMEVWIDERVSSSGTLWYRVRLGPFEGKRATDRVKRQLWERARIEAVRYQYTGG